MLQPKDKIETSSPATEFVDKHVVAEFLNISVRTVEQWTRKRKIPYFRTGYHTVRYRLNDITRAMRKNHFVEEIAVE
jgi:excisionase family DNA binding protein